MTKRQRRIRIILGLVFISLIAGAAAAFADDPTSPNGIGDLFSLPDVYKHDGPSTLFENYAPGAWQIDTELDFKNVLQNAGNAIVNAIWFFNVTVVYAGIALTNWIMSMTELPGVNEALAGLVGTSASTLAVWLLPATLAIGGVIAYAQRARDGRGAGLNQIAWVIVAGVFAVSLAVSPGVWTSGLDTVRKLGAESITDATGDAISANRTTPIEWDDIDMSGQQPKDRAARKTADGIWRTFVATPWCQANYGSLEACQRYGRDMLDQGTDMEGRKDYIKDKIYPQEGGKDSPTGQWVKGEQWPQRLGIVIMSSVAAVAFVIMLVALAFAALMALLLSLLLLAVGAFFVMLWVIPGRPRQWGVAWFEALVGAALISLVALLLFQAVVLVVTAVTSALPVLGWGATTVLAVAVLFVSRTAKNTLEQIFGVKGESMRGSGLAGYMALRTAGKLGGKAAKSISRISSNMGKSGSRGPASSAGPSRPGPRTGDSGGPSDQPSTPRRRNFRTAGGNGPTTGPAQPSRGGTRPGPSGPAVPGGGRRRKSGAGAGQRPHDPAPSRAPEHREPTRTGAEDRTRADSSASSAERTRQGARRPERARRPSTSTTPRAAQPRRPERADMPRSPRTNHGTPASRPSAATATAERNRPRQFRQAKAPEPQRQPVPQRPQPAAQKPVKEGTTHAQPRSIRTNPPRRR